MTMSDGRDAAQAVWTAVFDTAVAPVPAANRRADRWSNSFEMAFDTIKRPPENPRTDYQGTRSLLSIRTAVKKEFRQIPAAALG
jgi:hypothetical protein